MMRNNLWHTITNHANASTDAMRSTLAAFIAFSIHTKNYAKEAKKNDTKIVGAGVQKGKNVNILDATA